MSGSAPIRRLAPCPCGSGRKFKDCHGKLAHDARLAQALEFRARGESDAAREIVRQVLAEMPDLAAAWNDDGLLRLDDRDIEGAKASLRRALQLAPSFPQAHFNLSLVLLLEGRFAEGWREYAWRTQAPGYADYANFPFGMPRWSGEPLAGRSILVHAEQGFGDTLQFARFLPRLARDGATIDVFCQPVLAPLLARIQGVRQALSELKQRPTHDFHAPIIDVGAFHLPDADAPRWDGPYVAALPERIAHWAAELEALPRPRIGVVWKGSPKNALDRFRSLTAEQARSLFVQGPGYVNLQFHEPAPAASHGAAVLDAGPRIRDWDDTAALLEGLDALVTVDTAIAHLAGAMGRRVWTLVPCIPDWRYGLAGEVSPWYPSMRLFRQTRRGDWDPVLDALRAELAKQGALAGPLPT